MSGDTTARGLLTTEAACEYLAIGRTTLNGLVQRREIPKLMVGAAPRFAIKDLDAYIERLRRAS